VYDDIGCKVVLELERIISSLSLDVMHDVSAASVCLTGGRTANYLYRLPRVKKLLLENFSNFYFGDERCVGPDHQDSNYKMAIEALFSY